MHHAEPVVLLLVLMAVLLIVAHKSAIPYPVLLVLGGLSLSFVPFLPVIRLDPNFVLFFFFRRSSIRWRSSLRGGISGEPALDSFPRHRPCPHDDHGGRVGRAFFCADLPWAAAFALGAIVSPPDAVAAEAISNAWGSSADRRCRRRKPGQRRHRARRLPIRGRGHGDRSVSR